MLSLGTITATVVLVLCLPLYFNQVILPKPGVVLKDPLMDWLPAANCSWPIFLIIYGTVAWTAFANRSQPVLLLSGLMTYLLVSIARLVTMYMFTLEPPPGMILLGDPVINRLAYGSDSFAKDLFFSGHSSTLTILVMLSQHKWVRIIMILCLVAVGLMLIAQRVHYTVDIVTGIAVTWCVFALVHHMLAREFKRLQ